MLCARKRTDLVHADSTPNPSPEEPDVRRVVVAGGEDGRSRIASDEQVPDIGLVWTASPANLRAVMETVDPGRVYSPAEPPPGGALWFLSEIPPGKGMAPLTDSPPGMDVRGFHVTRTVDLVYILSGTLLLDVDEHSVKLGTGDAVVLQGANHAWRNPTDEPARFLDVLMSVLPAPS
jgi:mannose-6-phosphate isomerase-like protein (cupin superfamily)